MNLCIEGRTYQYVVYICNVRVYYRAKLVLVNLRILSIIAAFTYVYYGLTQVIVNLHLLSISVVLTYMHYTMTQVLVNLHLANFFVFTDMYYRLTLVMIHFSITLQ